jgi:hypothetical protein
MGEKLKADRLQRNRLHPAPWQLEGWGASGTILYRVLDAIGNPITQPTEDRASQVLIIEARNEAYEEHCDHVTELWHQNVERLKADNMRIQDKWREEVGVFSKALASARDEIAYLKEELVKANDRV